jgi:hypothetical protein
MRFTLLVRSYCHLCDDMLEALVPLLGPAPVDVLDVDAPEHAALEAEFGDAVPVLFAGPVLAANEVCRYRLDRERLASALSAGSGIR